ncbi:MAG: DUF4129 domain-containing protein [Chloroflexi bacterium]|nr:MAG: DUF4129 domain-containing protein [Chloroflexota bacterium]
MDMRSLFAVWLITLLSLSNLSAAAQPPPITFDDYWELVRDTRQAVAQMEAKPEATIRQELDALAAQWEQVTAVEYSDHSVVQLDSSHLAAELRSAPPDLKRLGSVLDALLQAHEEYPQKIFTPEDVAPLTRILARPEFQWQEQRPLQMPDWLARIEEWIERFRNRVLNATFRYGRVPLITVATLLFILSLFFISRSLSRNLVREAQLAADDNGNDELLTSKGAFKRAETLSTQGDYRNAIRYLYLSSLLVLDEQGLMRYDRSRTNREYLRSISSKPELAKPLRDVIDVFDRVWYGFEGIDEQTYQSYVERVDELREKKE